jgi:hypothetical protein
MAMEGTLGGATSGDQGSHQPTLRDVVGERDAFSAGRDLTVNNYFSG